MSHPGAVLTVLMTEIKAHPFWSFHPEARFQRSLLQAGPWKTHHVL
jgi:hypothetical protein